MKIDILCVGKIKETYFRQGIAEYEKRISRYEKLRILEVADEKTPDKAGAKEEEQILQLEGERLDKHIKDSAYLIALAIEGKQMDSQIFAQKLESLAVQGISHIQFLIGGSLGLDSQLKKRASLLLSFSQMTFPHQLMRMILLEQIYRGCRINHNEPYHK